MPRGFTDHPLSQKVKASRVLSSKDITRSYAILPRFENCRKRRIYETVKFTLCRFLAKVIIVLSTHPIFGILIFCLTASFSTHKIRLPNILTAQAKWTLNFPVCRPAVVWRIVLTCFLLFFFAKDFGSSIAGQQLPPQHGKPLLAQDAVRELSRRRDSASFARWHW